MWWNIEPDMKGMDLGVAKLKFSRPSRVSSVIRMERIASAIKQGGTAVFIVPFLGAFFYFMQKNPQSGPA